MHRKVNKKKIKIFNPGLALAAVGARLNGSTMLAQLHLKLLDGKYCIYDTEVLF